MRKLRPAALIGFRPDGREEDPGSLGYREYLPLGSRCDVSRGRVANPRKALRQNFAWLNRFTLSLLKQHPDRDSLAMKRRSCGWNENFLLEVLTGATL